ncbi:late embryogenesis abundant protein D-29-like [Vigna umbellata]|uniref:Uncharacterized protein n=2 Tax=Phaseolus angularis TaxID=3914 RepID=A0A0L9TQ42_PHAAN|nr:late embryogenesis abundant protein D-29 [Vigna angularis]XP_047146992.1 late embryogenesis abundant protein D-29-like [Vigna umbellata]KAG2408731.1 uncharacterized protein HKW66_Vig0035530 [Vigna angularis]KOM32289.1 hypothetical protein LR48_Vigan01g184500 [Vigna angularis]BAT75466.1 hypothetical protein VIGAN_01333300 [Vigna angularis var. angularis]
MNTLNMKFVVVVVCLAFFIGTTWGDVLKSAKATAEDAKDAAAPTVKAAKDSAASAAESAKEATAPAVDAAAPSVEGAAQKSESFAQWAYDKISGGFGMKSDDDKSKVVEKEKLQF